MARLTISKFLELVRRSRLVDREPLMHFVAELKQLSPSDRPQSSNQVADALIKAGLLTRWQCDKLLEGRHRGFFLGKYKLQGYLGTGGMSSVYLAEHVVMQRRVAIKVLPQSRVDDSSYLARFRREAQAAAAVDHRNIVRAYDIDNEERVHFIVMEYVEGRSLQDIVADEGPLSFDCVANYIAQAADALDCAHEAGLIHRDVKPANLLVDVQGTVKLLDLGLAKFSRGTEASSLTILHDENVLGTADYLAPEQAVNSHTVDHRADIYSLGCTMYFVLTGHPPYCEGSLSQRLMAHQNEAPPSIANDRPNVPSRLVAICERMMRKDPSQRYQRGGEIRDALRACQASESVVAAAGVEAQRESATETRSGTTDRALESKRPGSPRGVPPKSSRPKVSPPVRPQRPTEDTVAKRNDATRKGPDDPGRAVSAGDSLALLPLPESMVQRLAPQRQAQDTPGPQRTPTSKPAIGSKASETPTAASRGSKEPDSAKAKLPESTSSKLKVTDVPVDELAPVPASELLAGHDLLANSAAKAPAGVRFRTFDRPQRARPEWFAPAVVAVLIIVVLVILGLLIW